jgi:lactaldehyde reductase
MTAQRIVLNETSYFGAGSRNVLPQEITDRGFKKILLVTDKDLIQHGVAGLVMNTLDAAQIPYSVFDNIKQNPTIANVKEGLACFADSAADALVAVGGGSVIDTAKAIGIISANPEFADVRSLEGVAPTKHRSIPLIALPTTAGTAAEVTINYVITDEAARKKMVCVDPKDIPIVAIVDSELMASMPASLAAATGMDALTHAIEGYLTRGAWALTNEFEISAIEMIAQYLPAATDRPADPQAVEGMGLAQYVAGMGFSNVGLGIVHSMAHPLGAFYDIPHGVANAVLLPYVMAFNAPACGEKYRAIAKALGVAGTEAMSVAEANAAAVAAVRQLSARVRIPPKLNLLGVKEEDLPALAQAAFNDICTPGNPRDVTVAEIQAIYRQALA